MNATMPVAVQSPVLPTVSTPARRIREPEARTQRSARFDVMRVSACLAVILLHLSATLVMEPTLLGTVNWHVANLIDAATRWCVPVFVMLSGALLLDPRKQASPGEFWTRRMTRLLPALMTWSLIYFLWRAYFWKEGLFVGVMTQDVLAGRPYIHLYFLFLIAGLYLVTPFLSRAIGNLTSAQLRQVILIMGGLTMLANLSDFLTSSALTMFVPYLAYYAGGWYCAHLPAARTLRYVLVLSGAIITITVLTGLLVSTLGLDDRWSFYWYEDFSPTVIVSAVAVFILILRGAVPPRAEAIAQRLAPMTLGVYVAHPLIVEVLRYGYFHQFPVLLTAPYYIPVTFVATCVLTFGCIALIQTVPGLRRIV